MCFKIVKVMILCGLASMVSCNNMERLDTTNLKKEVEAHKIKKISESDILLMLNQKGQDLAKKMNCTDSLMNADTYQISFLDPFTYQTSIEKEKQILEALQYASEDINSFRAIPQKLTETDYAFYFVHSCNDNLEDKFYKILFKKAALIQLMNI
jgi:hypothetical protein